MYGVNEKDTILYFGDIDLSGVDIFLRLKNNFKEFSIIPSVSLYENLLRIGFKRENIKNLDLKTKLILMKTGLMFF